MGPTGERRGQGKSGGLSIEEFARQLFALEDKLVAGNDRPGYEPGEELGKLAKLIIENRAFADLQKGVLADHSLWRAFAKNPSREAGIALACFIDPSFAAEQAAFVAVIGRFAKTDGAVREFLESVSEGSAPGLIMMNSAATSKADEILNREDAPGDPPTRERDLQMLKLKLE